VEKLFDTIRKSVVAGSSGASNRRRFAGKIFERVADELRAEMRTADAEHDDIGDGSVAVAGPVVLTERIAELPHQLKRIGDHVADLGGFRRPVALAGPQRGMERRAPLGDVDDIAGEQALDPGVELAGAGQRHQQVAGAVGEAVAGIVEADAGGGRKEPVGAAGVLLEQIGKRDARQTLGVLNQCLPLG
jgi:hypothetical protein